MADQLDDAQFWLPSHFLTDDDILMDFSPSTTNGSLGSGSGSGSDTDLPSTGSETDEDESVSGLTRQIASSVITPDCSPHSKGWNLSSSPQSTLCGWVGKEEGSSRDSPNMPVSPKSSTDKEGGAETLDLLNKAAGEVARFKLTTTTTNATTRAGTGFFDCSNKGQFRPPPPSPLFTPTRLPYFPSLQFPPLSHVQQQMSMRQQQMISSQVNMLRNKNNEQHNKNRPSGVTQPAWPPLQAQNQPIQRGPQMFMGQPGPKRDCVGTGVFLPRRVDTPVEPRKKPEGGNPTKTPNGKNGKKGSNSNHQRSGSRQLTSKSTEIRLPSEWTY